MSLEQKVFVFFTAVLCVVVGLLGDSFGIPSQLLLLAAGVIVVGVPHGALDPRLASKSGLFSSRKSKWAFLALYGLIAMLTGLVWLKAPVIALFAFLFYGAFHFSLDWKNQVSRPAASAVGLTVVSMPVLANTESVGAIFEIMAGPGINSFLPVFQMIAVISALIVAIEVARLLRRNAALSLELATLLVAAALLPPLLFFFAFFCFLHSIRHLRAIAQELQLSPAKLIGKSLFYSVQTLFIVWLAWQSFGFELVWQDKLINAVFIGLAVLTVPHMLLHYYLERTEQKNASGA